VVGVGVDVGVGVAVGVAVDADAGAGIAIGAGADDVDVEVTFLGAALTGEPRLRVLPRGVLALPLPAFGLPSSPFGLPSEGLPALVSSPWEPPALVDFTSSPRGLPIPTGLAVP